MPEWSQLLKLPKPELTAEEQAYLDGPCEALCKMVDNWEIDHVRADLPPEMWDFVKRNKFFGLNIPKEYGGLGFPLRADEPQGDPEAGLDLDGGEFDGRRAEFAGPSRTADALRHRRAEGALPAAPGRRSRSAVLRIDRPAFAGSDATSIPDYGIVCSGEWNGAKVLGVRLTLNKRYITLAPVATLIGVAFRMYDPDGLVKDKKDIASQGTGAA